MGRFDAHKQRPGLLLARKKPHFIMFNTFRLTALASIAAAAYYFFFFTATGNNLRQRRAPASGKSLLIVGRVGVRTVSGV